MFRNTAVFVIALLLPGWGLAQSLGELARKERERREKNKTEGVEIREFSEGEIFDDDDEEAEEETAEPASGEEDAAPMPRRLDIDVHPEEEEAPEDESRERLKKEADFRSRYRAAQERLRAAREQKQVLDGIHFVEGMKYVDENGNVAIESLDHLRRLVTQAEDELALAQQAVENLKTEARRGGYPPGWLR